MNSKLICRYCLDEFPNSDTLNHVCGCRGSVQYICKECLIKNIQRTKSKVCELCNEEYKFDHILTPEEITRVSQIINPPRPLVFPRQTTTIQFMNRITAELDRVGRVSRQDHSHNVVRRLRTQSDVDLYDLYYAIFLLLITFTIILFLTKIYHDRLRRQRESQRNSHKRCDACQAMSTILLIPGSPS